MPGLTNDELETMILQLQTRLIKLATAAQVAELKALLLDYKSNNDADHTAIFDRLDAIETRLNDIEARLQALE